MGIRFRKSFKVGPVRLGVGRKSASIGIGVPGARVTKSTTGRTTRSVGIPGSGLSHVSTSGKKKAPKQQPVTQQRSTSTPQQRQAQAPQQVQQQQYFTPTAPKPKSRTSGIVWGVIAIVVVVIILASMF